MEDFFWKIAFSGHVHTLLHLRYRIYRACELVLFAVLSMHIRGVIMIFSFSYFPPVFKLFSFFHFFRLSAYCKLVQFAVIHLKGAIMLSLICPLKMLLLIDFRVLCLFIAISFCCKTLFSSKKLPPLSWTGRGNSGNFPSQIFRSPPYYLLPTRHIFFGYFSQISFLGIFFTGYLFLGYFPRTFLKFLSNLFSSWHE